MDTNTILKEWQKGTKLQNLEFLGINISKTLYLDRFSDEVSKGLNLKELVGNDGRPSTIKIGAEWTNTPQEEDFKSNLIRNDRMIGSMFYYYAGSDGQKNNIRFMFQVWRRQT
ncbi:hypothetical protein B9Z55_012347 [Caenorhabditis nigoni]|uniref:F-box associated domain-containing protein n=1 Tax=Caenorhabditis nigoni TaxID=1611254 RepID=A0A2G5TX00_9PELO|nr:hypothetical protein B9Z55_012347 [Caenorhabditis nigoni]